MSKNFYAVGRKNSTTVIFEKFYIYTQVSRTFNGIDTRSSEITQ